MMHDRSDRNTIVLNRVENNKKDGIVVHESSDLLVADNLVRGNRQGVRSHRESLRNRFVGNRLVGNGRGFELYGGTRDAILEDNLIRGSREIGMVLDAPGSRVISGIVEGSELGVDARAPASISRLRVREVERGLVVRPGAILRGDYLTVEASEAAVKREPNGFVRLVSSRVRSGETEPGRIVRWGPGTEEQGPGLPWTATVGIGLIVAAVVLELLHLMRSRRTPRGPEQPMWSAGG